MRTTLILAILILVMTTPAVARFVGPATCTCTSAELAHRAESAHKIYIGTVRSIDIQTDMIEPGREDPPVIVTIAVSESFKDSASGQTEMIHDSLTRVTCAGHDFKVDQEYLVFAYKRMAATYETWSLYDFKTGTYGVGGLCGGTKPLSDATAKADITALRQMKESGDPALTAKPNPKF